MLEMHACKMCRSIISKFQILAKSRKIKIGFAIILAEWIFCMIAFGQQSRKEYIYMGGKAIVTETFNQANGCSSSISPTSASFSTASGTGSVSVTSGSGCSWTASSNASWITVTSGGSGTGNGTVGYSVSSNSSPARSGTITIAGLTFTVNQAGVCTYTLNPTSASHAYSTSGGSVAVTAGGSCSWTSSSNDDWLSITNGYSGSGNGTVSYYASSNCLPDGRSGSLTVAGQSFNVSQSGYPNGQCTVDCMNNLGLPVQVCGAMCGCQ
jgi:hypothetical protein